MELDRDAAEQAIRNAVAEPLGLELHEAAGAIIEVANANMANAVRLISLQRGYDPREFALVAFGGAGPLHGAAIARGTRHPDRARAAASRQHGRRWAACWSTSGTTCPRCSWPPLTTRTPTTWRPRSPGWRTGPHAARGRGRRAGGDRLERTIEMRYLGQWRSMEVAVTKGTGLDDAVEQFHREHEREYSFRRDDARSSSTACN